MEGDFSFNVSCRGVDTFYLFTHSVLHSHTFHLGVTQYSYSTTVSCTASLEQLLIKCLAQGHPRVIGLPPPPHTHTQHFQILHFCKSSSCDQNGDLFFFSHSNAKSEITRAQKGAMTLHHSFCYATQHLGSDLISISWVTCSNKGVVIENENRKEKNICDPFALEREDGLEACFLLNCGAV